MSINNYGYMSVGSVTCGNVYNYGTMNFNQIQCLEIYNNSQFNIMKNGLINLGIFHLNKTGTLNINGMIIKGDETLDSNTKSYLEQYGKIVQNDESITFFGVFQVNITEAKLALPHRFGKYEKTTSGYEYIPGNWFSSSYDRVLSESKATGEKKYWRVKPITSSYDIRMATMDLFKGKISHAIVDCDFAPKMKFDVFSKTVISRDFLQETTCNQIATELKPARDHVLLNYIANALMTKDQNNLTSLLRKPLFIAEKQSDTTEQSNWGAWLFSGLPMIFSAPPKVKAEHIKQNSHTNLTGTTPENISKEDFIEALNEIVQSIAKDDFMVCHEIKEDILADFNKVNNKFTPQEQSDEIIPELDLMIENLKKNITAATKFAEELILEDKETSALVTVSNAPSDPLTQSCSYSNVNNTRPTIKS